LRPEIHEEGRSEGLIDRKREQVLSESLLFDFDSPRRKSPLPRVLRIALRAAEFTLAGQVAYFSEIRTRLIKPGQLHHKMLLDVSQTA
jgi:hypothetical protein